MSVTHLSQGFFSSRALPLLKAGPKCEGRPRSVSSAEHRSTHAALFLGLTSCDRSHEWPAEGTRLFAVAHEAAQSFLRNCWSPACGGAGLASSRDPDSAA